MVLNKKGEPRARSQHHVVKEAHVVAAALGPEVLATHRAVVLGGEGAKPFDDHALPSLRQHEVRSLALAY